MSFRPKRGTRMPLRRPFRTSWKMNGSHMIGTSWMYRTAGRATITFLFSHFISPVEKW